MKMTQPKGEGSSPSTLWSIAKNLLDGSATTRSLPDKALHQEEVFTAGITRSLGQGETINLHVKNPVDSGIVPIFHFGEFTRAGEMTLRMRQELSNIGTTTTIDEHSAAMGSDEVSVLDVDEVDTFDSGMTHHEQRYFGSGREILYDESYKVSLLEGHDFMLEITSHSGSNFCGLRLGWWEHKQGDS